MEEKDIKKVERIIGYTFKDKALLERALTHGSASKTHLKTISLWSFWGTVSLILSLRNVLWKSIRTHTKAL